MGYVYTPRKITHHGPDAWALELLSSPQPRRPLCCPTQPSEHTASGQELADGGHGVDSGLVRGFVCATAKQGCFLHVAPLLWGCIFSWG